jgi:hypothetical protein
LGCSPNYSLEKSLRTKRNEFVEALGLYQKQIIRTEMFPFLNEFHNENPLELHDENVTLSLAIRFILPNANVHSVLKQNPFRLEHVSRDHDPLDKRYKFVTTGSCTF